MKHLRLIPLVVPLALVACGGGGGSGTAGVVIPEGVRDLPASTGSNISADNYASFATPAARLVLGASGSSLVGMLAAGRESPAALAGDARRGLLARALAQGAATLGRERPQATGTQTQACDVSGTMTVSADDADTNQRLSAGDSVFVSVNQCTFVAGDPPLNGTFSMFVNAVELDGNLDPTAIDTNGDFAGFTVGSVASLDGAFHLWYRQDSATSERMRLSFDRVNSTVAGQTARYNVDMVATASATGASYAIDGSIDLDGETYKVVQGPPFTVPAGSALPSVGALDLKDAVGDTMRLEARAGNLAGVGFVPAGSGTPMVSLPDQPWSSLAP